MQHWAINETRFSANLYETESDTFLIEVWVAPARWMKRTFEKKTERNKTRIGKGKGEHDREKEEKEHKLVKKWKVVCLLYPRMIWIVSKTNLSPFPSSVFSSFSFSHTVSPPIWFDMNVTGTNTISNSRRHHQRRLVDAPRMSFIQDFSQ